MSKFERIMRISQLSYSDQIVLYLEHTFDTPIISRADWVNHELEVGKFVFIDDSGHVDFSQGPPEDID